METYLTIKKTAEDIVKAVLQSYSSVSVKPVTERKYCACISSCHRQEILMSRKNNFMFFTTRSIYSLRTFPACEVLFPVSVADGTYQPRYGRDLVTFQYMSYCFS